MKKKLEKKLPPMKIQVKKLINDWWQAEGSKSLRKFIRNNFTLYFEVK